MVGTLKEFCLGLLEDEGVSRWHKNLNSESAKRIYLEGLAKYCAHRGLTPGKVVEEFREDQHRGEDLLQDFILGLKGRYTPKVVNGILVGVRSWLRHNGLQVVRKINVGNTRLTPTIEDEYPPDPKELRRILDHADVRGKVAISLIAFAGLRPGAASRLRLKDIPDLEIEGDKVSLGKIPAQVKVPAPLSKNKKPYFTFLIEEGCTYLKEYLELRLRRGEKLTSESPLLVSNPKARIKTFTRKAFQKLIKRTFSQMGFPFRPYVLRSYFDTAIMNARGVPYDYQQFFMGHSGSIEATYTVNKKLPEWQVEEMRNTFKQLIAPRLSTAPIGGIPSREEIALETMRKLAETYGIDPLKVRIEKAKELGKELTLQEEVETIQGEIRKFISPTYKERYQARTETNGGIPQYETQIVKEEGLVPLLNQGWDIVKELSSGKIVVRRPTPLLSSCQP